MAWAVLASTLHAQTAPAPRLAIVPGTDVPSELADLLTVGLSSKPSLQLLEREQISRVLREQALAAQGRDALRLGQLLGAEGLLLLEVVSSGTNRSLHSRLLAVKSGVHLASVRSQLPLPEPDRWASNLASRFEPLFSKLSVATHDAIPLSIVNLRAAVASDASRDLERQLTFLSIERLSLDPRLFVLERRRMDLLADEKELQPTDDSAFWNGRYLLEGTIDRDGSSPDTVTLDARLAGPGGSPVTDIALKGPRNNLPALVEQLAVRVLEILRRPAAPVAWKPDSEATRFLEEARWAFKWHLWPEAQSAADAAWALGRHDVDTALLRVRSLLPELRQDRSYFAPVTTTTPAELLMEALRELQASEPGALPQIFTNGPRVKFAYTRRTPSPTPAQVVQATRALALYAQFSGTLPTSEPKPESPWYLAGIEALTATGPILQGALLSPAFSQGNKAALAELRAEARRVVDRILNSTSVRETYWTGGQVLRAGDLSIAVKHSTNIFRTMVEWGPFWQETPDDCVRMWRHLLSSPVFSVIHTGFWIRKHDQPQVLGWGDTDSFQNHIVWQRFVGELAASTNFLHQMEGKALQAIATDDRAGRDARFEELLTLLHQTHRQEFLVHPLEILDSHWGLRELASVPDGQGQQYPANRISVARRTDLEAMQIEWTRTADARAAGHHLARQKAFLTATNPGSIAEFAELFGIGRGTIPPEHHAELQPLLAGFESNVLSRPKLPDGTPSEWTSNPEGAKQIRMLEMRLGRGFRRAPIPQSNGAPAVVITVPASNNLSMPLRMAGQPGSSNRLVRPSALTNSNTVRTPPPQAPAAAPAAEPAPILPVTQFVRIPRVVLAKRPEPFDLRDVELADVAVEEEAIWLDARLQIMELEQLKTMTANRMNEYATWVRQDPKSGKWSLVAEMLIPSRNGIVKKPRSCILKDTLYVSDWNKLRRWSADGKELPPITVPWQGPPALAEIHDRLYAIDDEAIYEIPTDGSPVKILASTRRRPAVTPLDSLEKFEYPRLLEGPDKSLLTTAGKRIHQWNGRTWSEMFPHEVLLAQSQDRTTALRGIMEPATAAVWMTSSDRFEPKLVLAWHRNDHGDLNQPGMGRGSRGRERPVLSADSKPAWTLPELTSLSRAHYLPLGKGLLVYIDLLPTSRIGGRPLPTDHASLSFLRDGRPPVSFRIRYDSNKAPPPSIGSTTQSAVMLAPGENLEIRATREHLLVFHPAQPGYWMIPRSAFER